MDKPTDVINKFYTHYIMRDILAKIMPGGILILVIYIQNNNTSQLIKYLSKLPLWIWLFLIGICYLLGYCIQLFGVWCKWIKEYSNKIAPIEKSAKDNIKEQDKDETYQQRTIKIYQSKIITSLNLQQRERYVVLRELTSNISFTFFISGIVFLLKTILSCQFSIINLVLISLFLLLSFLLKFHQGVLNERLRIYEDKLINIISNHE